MKVRAQWIVRRDLDDVERILAFAVAPYDWTVNRIEQVLAKPQTVGLCWKNCRQIMQAVLFYRIEQQELIVGNFVVAKEKRRTGIGKQIVNDFCNRFSAQTIVWPVPEEHLEMQLFLQACGLLAVKIKTVAGGRELYIFEKPACP